MKRNLLVVEDDSGLRKYFVLLLEQMGHSVFTSSNGAEALSLMSGNDAFHLVLTDIDMPIMNGIEMLEEMRSRNIDIPVCVVSGINDDTIFSKLEELGCSDYLKKPVSANEIRNKIKFILDKHSGSLSLKA